MFCMLAQFAFFFLNLNRKQIGTRVKRSEAVRVDGMFAFRVKLYTVP